MKNRMNIKKTGLSLLIMLISLVSVSNSLSVQKEVKVIYIKVEVNGLSCPFCAYGLEKNLKKIEDAKDVFISVEDAYTTFNVPQDKQPTKDKLKKIVKDAGFTAGEIIFSDKPFFKDEK